MMKIKVGMIGLGTTGEEMLQAFMASNRFELIAVWDCNEKTNTKLANSLKLKVSPPSILIKDIDMLYVGTPPSSHWGYLELAFRNGKMVFCEKPLSSSLEESTENLENWPSHPKTAVNFNFVGTPSSKLLRELLQEERVINCQMNLHLPHWPRSYQKNVQWLKFQYEGGFLREIASHWISLLYSILGEIKIGYAHTKFPDEVNSEIASSAMLFANDVPCTFSATQGGAGPQGMTLFIYGEHNSYCFQSGGKLSKWQNSEWQDITPQSQLSDTNSRLNELYQYLTSGQGDIITIEHAYKVQSIIEKLRSV